MMTEMWFKCMWREREGNRREKVNMVDVLSIHE
jgi:hypothetical protein